MTIKFKPMIAIALASVAIVADAASQSLPLELTQTADGGWRFGNEALTVSLSSTTGWPIAWDVDGNRVLSGGKTPDTPWGILFAAVDDKKDQKTSGRVKVLSVEKDGGNCARRARRVDRGRGTRHKRRQGGWVV